METVKKSAERVGSGESVLPRPQKSADMAGAGEDPSAGGQAAVNLRGGSDLDTVPDDAVGEAGAFADLGQTDHASGGFETVEIIAREHEPSRIEVSTACGKRSAAVERFERRAEEIARAAEIIEWTPMEEPADLLALLREKRCPEVGDESGFSGGNACEEARGHGADACVEERVVSSGAEGRDSVPFGLKRRIPVGISILDDEERRRPAALTVSGEKGGKIRLDDRVRVHDEEVAPGEPAGGVPERARRAEDLRLQEEAQVREIRRAIAQMAFDLFAKMMKIDARFQDAVAGEPRQVRPNQRDVQEREERLGNTLGDRPETHAPARSEEKGPHEGRET